MQTRHVVLAATVLFAILPTGRLPSKPVEDLVVLDLRAALGTEDDRGTRWAYDAAKAIGALQGIVNRERPRLFVLYLNNGLAMEKGASSGEAGMDRFWLQWLREEGRLLASHEIDETTDVWKVLEIFQDSIAGLAAWDEAVPSTANVASTLAGAEDLLPVRVSEDEGSLFVQIKERFPGLAVKRDLRGKFIGEGAIPDTAAVPSTGSAKCDAYVWAIETLLKTGKCSSTHLAYYVDGVPWNSLAPHSTPYPDLGNAGVLNADYWISRKAFFFDLSPWEDRAATDDPTQPTGTDYRTLLAILQAANERNANDRVITCGGFVPWWLKYAKSDWGGRDLNETPHEPVPTEWQFVDILSAYNTVLDADAFGLVGLANASVYRHYPLADRYTQDRKQTEDKTFDPKKTYVLFAMLDYDSSAWLAQAFPGTWGDAARGKFPLLWGFNPILSDRVPMVFDGVFESISPNDTIGADEGLGYINPNLLDGNRVFSDLPPAGEMYLREARPYFEKFSMTATAFVITGRQGMTTERALEILALLSPIGVGFQGGGRVSDGAHFGVGFKEQEEDWNPGMTPGQVADRLESRIREKGHGSFLFFRCILMRPSQIVEGIEVLRARAPELEFEVLDPVTYYEFLKGQ